MSDLDEMLFETLADEKLDSQIRLQQVDLIIQINNKHREAQVKESVCLDFKYTRLDGEFQNSMPAMAAKYNDLETVKLLMENGFIVMLEQALYTAIFHGHIDIIHHLLTLNPKLEATITKVLTNGTETNCLSLAKTLKKNVKSLDAYINLKNALDLALKLPARMRKTAKTIEVDKKPSENKTEPKQEAKQVEVTYPDMLASFTNAIKFDSLFVMKYLARCLHQINIGKATEDQYPVLDKMTVKLFEIFNDDDYPDTLAYQHFKDILLVEWLAYEPAKDNYFFTKLEKWKFLDRMFKGECPAAKFAEYAENGEITIEEDNHVFIESKSLPVSNGSMFRQFTPKEEKQLPNYFESFLKLDVQLKKVHLQRYQDFGADEIEQSVIMFAKSFGIKNEFKFCFAYPGSIDDDHEFITSLRIILKDSRNRYIPIVSQTREGTHAVACVIDKVQRKIFAVDPERDRNNSETELVNHLKSVRTIIEDGFENFALIQAASGQVNTPQGPEDGNNCGIYTAMIILAILLKQERIQLKSTNTDVQKVLDTLEIDVAVGKLPRSEFLNTYIGALLLACEDFRMNDNKLLNKF